MGLCGGRECGGGIEITSEVKNAYETWKAKPAVAESPAAKDADVMSVLQALYNHTISHRQNGDKTNTELKAIHEIHVLKPKLNYYFNLHIGKHPDINKEASSSVTFTVLRNTTDDDWKFQCPGTK